MHKLEGLAPRRELLGLSRAALADMAGVTRQAIYNWEIGKAWPLACTLPDLAGALCCSVDDLYHTPEALDAEGSVPCCQDQHSAQRRRLPQTSGADEMGKAAVRL